ncbi:MAG: hypothetical protein DYH08_00650 [Actinobacteria bacterium ATB1]|nr:hypothetical protein [Actinobacteria bacterium ATB1]
MPGWSGSRTGPRLDAFVRSQETEANKENDVYDMVDIAEKVKRAADTRASELDRSGESRSRRMPSCVSTAT